MGQAVKEAYGDLFLLKANPTNVDRELIEGKFKSAHNTSPLLAKLMANTFFALLPFADLKASDATRSPVTKTNESDKSHEEDIEKQAQSQHRTGAHRPTLHYNIQIHLPATKDIEVFNAIFKSLKEHLLD